MVPNIGRILQDSSPPQMQLPSQGSNVQATDYMNQCEDATTVVQAHVQGPLDVPSHSCTPAWPP